MSVALYGGVLADVLAHAPRAIPGTAALGGVGALLLVAALVRAEAALVVPPVAFLGVAYAVALVVHGSRVDDAAPLVAVGLLLSAELASWSVDARLRIPAERAVVRARALALFGLAFAAIALSALAVALAAAPAGSGLAWTLLGAASAVAVIGLAVRLARTS
ncbi:MAG TPA: hypothetical protein VGH92_07115 [Gaiellaceae bacterium]